MKTVTIPECMNPFEVIVNNNRYRYPAGTEQTVPKEVAEVIDVHMKNHAERTAPEYVPSAGGGFCKLKLTVESDVNFGELILVDGNNTTIDLRQNHGTTELDVPCGSALVLACEYFRSADKLTQVYGCDHAAVYQAPSEPGAVASLKVYF